MQLDHKERRGVAHLTSPPKAGTLFEKRPGIINSTRASLKSCIRARSAATPRFPRAHLGAVRYSSLLLLHHRAAVLESLPINWQAQGQQAMRNERERTSCLPARFLLCVSPQSKLSSASLPPTGQPPSSLICRKMSKLKKNGYQLTPLGSLHPSGAWDQYTTPEHRSHEKLETDSAAVQTRQLLVSV